MQSSLFAKRPLETQNFALQSVSGSILEFLKGKDYVFGGVIDDYIRSRFGHKASNCGRRCRELVQDGLLEATYEQINGKGPRVVKYRLI